MSAFKEDDHVIAAWAEVARLKAERDEAEGELAQRGADIARMNAAAHEADELLRAERDELRAEVARLKHLTCRMCRGSGSDEYGAECSDCDGRGFDAQRLKAEKGER